MESVLLNMATGIRPYVATSGSSVGVEASLTTHSNKIGHASDDPGPDTVYVTDSKLENRTYHGYKSLNFTVRNALLLAAVLVE